MGLGVLAELLCPVMSLPFPAELLLAQAAKGRVWKEQLVKRLAASFVG